MSGVSTFDINFPSKVIQPNMKEWLKQETEMDQTGSQKGWLIFLTRRAHMWPSFAYVASLQGKGPRKHKQQRSCSWSREAVACLPRPLYGKQWIEWRTGLWHRNRRLLQLREAIAFLRLHLHSVNIYPTGKHASFHSFCTESSLHPRGTMLGQRRHLCLGLESCSGCRE